LHIDPPALLAENRQRYTFEHIVKPQGLLPFDLVKYRKNDRVVDGFGKSDILADSPNR
jgi:hypothetical protein